MALCAVMAQRAQGNRRPGDQSRARRKAGAAPAAPVPANDNVGADGGEPAVVRPGKYLGAQQALSVDFDWVPLERLHVWVKNPRKNLKAVAKVKASIEAFGWVRPIVVNQHPDAFNEIIVGHTARLAAKELGIELVPVRFVHLEPSRAHAAAIADNKLNEEADWDQELLALLLTDNAVTLGDFMVAGFSEAELNRLGKPEGEPDDAVPTRPKRPITKPGDLWVLGRHRLICGDSTDAKLVARCLAGAKPELMVTDPPYGVKLDSTWRDDAAARKGVPFTKQKHTGKIANDDRADWTDAYRLFPGSVAYVWHAGVYAGEVAMHLQAVQLQIRAQLIWAKAALVMSRGAYHWQHEPCWYAVRQGASASWIGGRKQTTLWEIASKVGFTKKGNEDMETQHGSQKPVEAMARPMRNHKGKGVYDPFLGSGTSVVAAERNDRICYGQEMDPGYCDVIVQRWQNLTGGKAVRKKAA